MRARGIQIGERELTLSLMEIKGGARCFAFDPKRDRFTMPHCADSNIRSDLNANRISINGEQIAIAAQYPYHHQLESQFMMLVDNRTPALIVLASDVDIRNNELPEYFSHSFTYGRIKAVSTYTSQVDLSDDIQAKVYRLEVTGYEAAIDIPVVHVYNWPDHHTVSPKATSNLVALIDSIVADKRDFYQKRKSRAIQDPNKLLPVIHCRAGVGRTGQTIAAMAMKRFPEMDLSLITKNIRASRNDYMIQTPAQMETLVKLSLRVDTEN